VIAVKKEEEKLSQFHNFSLTSQSCDDLMMKTMSKMESMQWEMLVNHLLKALNYFESFD
jgi:hypothetical protein